MKENSGSSVTAMMVTHELGGAPVPAGFVSRGAQQKPHYTQQLACKENILEQPDALGTSLHNSVGPLRPSQPQHLPPVNSFPAPLHPEVSREYFAEPVDQITSASSEYRGHMSPLPNHFLLSSGHAHLRTRQQQQPQQTFRLRFGRQILSCDTLGNELVNPLPQLKWVRSADLWWTMRSKDVSKTTPEVELHIHHPEILSSMRVILLDWMMEV
jgi:hypothetical protein